MSSTGVDAIRPLLYIRVRLYRGGQAEYIRDLLRDEQAALLEDLGRLRGEGKPETDPEVEDIRAKYLHLVNALRDIDAGLIQLAGPDEDPRR